MSGKDVGRLTTVKVPALFEAPFLRAQDYVQRYFADRVENPDTATISIAGERYVLLRAASLSGPIQKRVGPAPARWMGWPVRSSSAS